MNFELKDNAVLIADVHYRKGDKLFLSLLNSFLEKPPSQVIFLGDIFHLLLPFDFLIQYNIDAIDLINKLSLKTEVYYLYGNHDFCIDNLFTNVKFSDYLFDKKLNLFITHGDLNKTPISYRIYSKIIRNRIILKVLNIFSLNFINNWLFKKLLNKKIKCSNILNFEKIALSKTDNYNYVIEGHYHQGKIINNYINVPAFICNKSYNLIKLDNNVNIKEVKYGF